MKHDLYSNRELQMYQAYIGLIYVNILNLVLQIMKLCVIIYYASKNVLQ